MPPHTELSFLPRRARAVQVGVLAGNVDDALRLKLGVFDARHRADRVARVAGGGRRRLHVARIRRDEVEVDAVVVALVYVPGWIVSVASDDPVKRALGRPANVTSARAVGGRPADGLVESVSMAVVEHVGDLVHARRAAISDGEEQRVDAHLLLAQVLRHRVRVLDVALPKVGRQGDVRRGTEGPVRAPHDLAAVGAQDEALREPLGALARRVDVLRLVVPRDQVPVVQVLERRLQVVGFVVLVPLLAQDALGQRVRLWHRGLLLFGHARIRLVVARVARRVVVVQHRRAGVNVRRWVGRRRRRARHVAVPPHRCQSVLRPKIAWPVEDVCVPLVVEDAHALVRRHVRVDDQGKVVVSSANA